MVVYAWCPQERQKQEISSRSFYTTEQVQEQPQHKRPYLKTIFFKQKKKAGHGNTPENPSIWEKEARQ